MTDQGALVYKHLTEAAAAYALVADDPADLESFQAALTPLQNRAALAKPNGQAPPPVQAKKRVFMALPRYGQSDTESVRAACVWATDDKILATLGDDVGSALCFGFNKLFCLCLNDHQGFDYFAMLHSDVFPRGPWLDVLIEEMDKYNLDVIHASCMIKDFRGLTSTAVGPRNTPWGNIRRITVEELHKLPETFVVDDVLRLWGSPSIPNAALLNNTGCMVVKVAPWCRRFLLEEGFNFKDKVEEVNGKLVAYFAPEDWNMGRWCARNGVRVGGTRRVQTEHFGRAAYSTGIVWGEWSQDKYFFGQSDVARGTTPDDTQHGNNWTTPDELNQLTTWATGCLHAAEIGTWKGRSAEAILKGLVAGPSSDVMPTLLCVDPYRPEPGNPNYRELKDEAGREGVIQQAMDRMRPFNSKARWLIHFVTSETAALIYPQNSMGLYPAGKPPQLDLIFIDGDHRYEAVQKDIRGWWPYLRMGGRMCGHDSWEPGVAKSVLELFGDDMVMGAGTLWSVIKTSETLATKK